MEPNYLLNKLPENAPDLPESLETILEDVKRYIIPGLTHWQSPNFFAYYPASSSTAGFLGEMLCTAFNVVGFSWITSPAATELEFVVTDWLGRMLSLPKSFLFSGTGGGVIHGSASEAVLCALVTARNKALEELNPPNINKLVPGISPENLRVLLTSAASDFALSPGAFDTALVADVAAWLTPFFLCATVGTTSSAAVDPLEELGHVANKYRVWVHVDAAYAGNAGICPEFRHYLNGVELADSFSMSPHKWLLTYMDCCCTWVRDNGVVDYKDWQIALNRRFRAIRLWLVLRRHGAVRLQSHIRSDVALARRFEMLVLGDIRFEVVAKRMFSLVCFRLVSGGSELNATLLEAVNATGHAYMTHTVIGEVYVLRFVVGGAFTQERHVDEAWKLIQEQADALLI
ncbi:hypothetical protein AMTRI_Chr04g181190 [Amborella trichopoda]